MTRLAAFFPLSARRVVVVRGRSLFHQWRGVIFSLFLFPSRQEYISGGGWGGGGGARILFYSSTSTELRFPPSPPPPPPMRPTEEKRRRKSLDVMSLNACPYHCLIAHDTNFDWLVQSELRSLSQLELLTS